MKFFAASLAILGLALAGTAGWSQGAPARGAADSREVRERDASRLVREAEDLQRQRKVVEAAAAFRKAAERNPEDPALWDQAGWAHLSAGQADPARQAFEQARKLTPPGVTVSGGLLVAYYALANKDELLKLVRQTVPPDVATRAEPVLTRGVAAQQRTLDWNFGLGYLYVRVLGNSRRALPFAEAVAAENPKHAQAWLLLTEINQALNRGPQEDAAAIRYLELAPETADAYRLRAYRCYIHQQYQAAMDEYQEGITKHPEEAELYYGLARVYERQNQVKQAEATYQKLVDLAGQKKLDVLRAQARAQMANFQLRVKNYAGALGYFREATTRPDASPGVHATLGALLVLQGKWSEAIPALDAVSERDEKLRGRTSPAARGDLIQARYRAALCRLAAGQRDPAATALRAALEYRGEARAAPEVEMRAFLVWLAGKGAPLGPLAYSRSDERWASFQWREPVEEDEARVSRRTSPQAAAWRAILAEVKSKNADCWPVRYALARQLAGEGASAEAVSLLQEGIRLRGDWWAPHYALGDHYTREGKNPQAQAALERVVALAPECRAARVGLSLLRNRPVDDPDRP